MVKKAVAVHRVLAVFAHTDTRAPLPARVRVRSNEWLATRCAATAAAVLYLCAFVNFDSLIALHNVSHCREADGKGAELDIAYLQALGIDALPALHRLAATADGERLKSFAALRTDELQGELSRLLGDWRGWTYHRQRLRDGAPSP